MTSDKGYGPVASFGFAGRFGILLSMDWEAHGASSQADAMSSVSQKRLLWMLLDQRCSREEEGKMPGLKFKSEYIWKVRKLYEAYMTSRISPSNQKNLVAM